MTHILDEMQLKIVSSDSQLDSFLEILKLISQKGLFTKTKDNSALENFFLLHYNKRTEVLKELLCNEVERNSEEYHSDTCEIDNDILPAAFSNVFGLCILVVPNCYDIPMMPLIPRILSTNSPFCMIYDVFKKIYFPLFNTEMKEVEENAENFRKCYCGSKAYKKPTCRTIRCVCYKGNESCAETCRCRGCGNNKPTHVKLTN